MNDGTLERDDGNEILRQTSIQVMGVMPWGTYLRLL
jgi:hypothetical protein